VTPLEELVAVRPSGLDLAVAAGQVELADQPTTVAVVGEHPGEQRRAVAPGLVAVHSGNSAETHPFRGGRKRVRSVKQTTDYNRADSPTFLNYQAYI